MTAPSYAQTLTPRIATSSPVNDERLAGIDFEVPPAEAAVAARWLERLRAERAAREVAACD